MYMLEDVPAWVSPRVDAPVHAMRMHRSRSVCRERDVEMQSSREARSSGESSKREAPAVGARASRVLRKHRVRRAARVYHSACARMYVHAPTRVNTRVQTEHDINVASDWERCVT